MKNLIIVKAGENVFMDAEVFGKPLPKVSWKKDGAPLVLAEGMKMAQKKHVHLLELYSVTRKESGDYTITAENINGSKYATIKVKVLGKFESSFYTVNVYLWVLSIWTRKPSLPLPLLQINPALQPL